MATSFKKTFITNYKTLGDKPDTPDTFYWNNLEFPITQKEFGAITHIEFSPVDPYDFAVTCSSRVQIYSSKTNQISKVLSRFKEIAYSGSFRSDGRLLVAGGSEGVVRMFDMKEKSLLRMFKGHKGPVHVCKFTLDKYRVFSGSDDRTVNVWDIATEESIISYKEHQDYIRAGAVSHASQDIILSGSYDHKVKLYDIRVPESILTVDHGYPVEDVIMYPSGGIFITAGGNVVKVWDALAGGKMLTQLSGHHKTVTCLCLCNKHQRLLTAGLDRHVAVYDVMTYQQVHSMDYPTDILSLAVSPDDKTVVVGAPDGSISIQHRKKDKSLLPQRKRNQKSYRYTIRGRTYVPTKNDYIVHHVKREHLTEYDKLFQKFEHSKALDEALKVSSLTPEVTIAVIRELIRRGAIRSAIAGRDVQALRTLFKFIHNHMLQPQYMSTLIDVSNVIIDIYASQVGQSSGLDSELKKLRNMLDREISEMKTQMELMGVMDALFAASSYNDDDDDDSKQIEASTSTTSDSKQIDNAIFVPSQTAIQSL